MKREQKPGAARWCELAKALRYHGALTKPQIMAETGWAFETASAWLGGLLAQGEVEVKPGSKPALYRLTPTLHAWRPAEGQRDAPSKWGGL